MFLVLRTKMVTHILISVYKFETKYCFRMKLFPLLKAQLIWFYTLFIEHVVNVLVFRSYNYNYNKQPWLLNIQHLLKSADIVLSNKRVQQKTPLLDIS